MGLLSVILSFIHVALCVTGVKRGSGMDLPRVFHLPYPFSFIFVTQAIINATSRQLPCSVTLSVYSKKYPTSRLSSHKITNCYNSIWETLILPQDSLHERKLEGGFSIQ